MTKFRRSSVRHTDDNPRAGGGLTSMLDVIFLIIAFFAVTMTMPSEEITFAIQAAPPAAGTAPQDPLPANPTPLFASIEVRLAANADGSLAGAWVDGEAVGTEPVRLDQKLRRLRTLLAPNAPDQAVISAPKNLHYRELMRTLQVCTRAGLSKLRFVDSR